MKKLFASLMVGFGATLAVFIVLSMPPGGWGVAVGVGLGLLGCLPLLLVLVMLINRGQTDRRPARDYDEQQPSVIIIQQPAFQAPVEPAPYDLYAGSNPNYGYFEAPDYYAQPVDPRLRQPRYMAPAARPLQPAQPRRRPQPQDYRPQPEYYGLPSQYQYPPDYYAQPEPEYDYYEEADQGEEYDPYYEERSLAPQPQPYYGYSEPSAIPPRPRQPVRRSARPNPPVRRALRSDEAVEAEFRTIGDNE